MAYFKTFAEVAERYNSVKPINGKANPLKFDIRPIFGRRYTTDRIVKIDDNKYALLDSWTSWHSHYESTHTEHVSNPTSNAYAATPIVWEKRDDGFEYVRIRSIPDRGMSPNRAILFNYVLPHGLRFGYADSAHKSGKHVINATTANCGVVRYDLPRNYVICNSAGKVIRDADYELWFKRVGDDVWERVGKLNPKATKKTDKELLKEFDVHIKQFYEWMGAILPVMNNNNTDIFEEYDKLLSDDMVHKQWGHPLRKGRILDAEEYRTILKDENHPKRVALAVILAKEMDVIGLNNGYNPNTKEWIHTVVVNYPKTENEVKALRSKFYSHIKSGAGLYKVEYV